MLDQIAGIRALHGKTVEYDAIMSRLQVIHYVAKFMYKTGLLC